MRKGVIVLSGMLLALAICEILLRIILPQAVSSSLSGTKTDCYDKHPIYFVTLRKNTTCLYAATNKEYTAKTKLNNLGFREESVTAIEKAPGTKRIIFIGDSFTFGQGVKTNEAFPKVTEIKLQNKHIPVEAINAGIIGVGPAWYYLTLKERIIPLKPDIVVVNLYLGNDLTDIDYFSWKDLDTEGLPEKITTEYEYVDQDGSRRFANTPKRYRIPFLRDSHLMIFLSNLLVGNPAQNNTEIAFTGSPCYLNPGCNDYEQQMKKLEKVLVGMQKLAKENSISLLVTLIPWELQLKREILEQSGMRLIVTDKRRYLLSNRIEEMLTKNGIQTLSLLPSFDAYEGNQQIFYPQDRHWTKQGHAIAADAITQALIPLLITTPPQVKEKGQ